MSPRRVWGSGGSQEGHYQGVPPKGLQQDLEVGFRSWKILEPRKIYLETFKIDWFWGKNVPFSRGHFRRLHLSFWGFFFSFKVGFWLVSGSFTYEYLFEMASFFWRSGIVSFRECISVGEKRVLKLFFSFWFTDVHGKMVAILKFPGVHHPISSQIITTSVISSPPKRLAKSMGQLRDFWVASRSVN